MIARFPFLVKNDPKRRSGPPPGAIMEFFGGSGGFWKPFWEALGAKLARKRAPEHSGIDFG